MTSPAAPASRTSCWPRPRLDSWRMEFSGVPSRRNAFGSGSTLAGTGDPAPADAVRAPVPQPGDVVARYGPATGDCLHIVSSRVAPGCPATLRAGRRLGDLLERAVASPYPSGSLPRTRCSRSQARSGRSCRLSPSGHLAGQLTAAERLRDGWPAPRAAGVTSTQRRSLRRPPPGQYVDQLIHCGRISGNSRRGAA